MMNNLPIKGAMNPLSRQRSESAFDRLDDSFSETGAKSRTARSAAASRSRSDP